MVCDYLEQQEMLHLYGTKATGLPDWFLTQSAVEDHHMLPFHKMPDSLLYRTPFENGADGPRVSTPERAVLELLSEIGKHQPLHEAHELMESAYSLRADVLSDLLRTCSGVKTVRLYLQLGREFLLRSVMPFVRLQNGSWFTTFKRTCSWRSRALAESQYCGSGQAFGQFQPFQRVGTKPNIAAKKGNLGLGLKRPSRQLDATSGRSPTRRCLKVRSLSLPVWRWCVRHRVVPAAV
jgi:hypothetical protein